MLTMNLATRPFGRNRLFWLLSGAAALALVGAAAAMAVYWTQHREPAPELIARERRLAAELQQLTARDAQLRQTLEDPDNAEVLERSRFLNLLLYRKGISWTQTFSDLEKILPPRVLMMDIRPEVDYDNRVRLEMRVGAETPQDFIEFLMAVEDSELFRSPELHGSSPPNENQPLYQYQVTVRYDQQL